MRHGELHLDDDEFLAVPDDDPDLALVYADMGVWSALHPCECEALCECEPGL